MHSHLGQGFTPNPTVGNSWFEKWQRDGGCGLFVKMVLNTFIKTKSINPVPTQEPKAPDLLIKSKPRKVFYVVFSER